MTLQADAAVSALDSLNGRDFAPLRVCSKAPSPFCNRRVQILYKSWVPAISQSAAHSAVGSRLKRREFSGSGASEAISQSAARSAVGSRPIRRELLGRGARRSRG